jgi:hypothetical protein
MDIHNITNGIHDNISILDYHANKTHLSATGLKIARRSLKEYQWWRDGKMPEKTGSHFGFGNAFELALLDKVGFSAGVGVFPDQQFVAKAMEVNPKLIKPRASTTYAELTNAWEANNIGRYHINDHGDESWDTIQHMLESCYADKIIQALIKNTEYQLSLFWTDPETGLNLKTRPDVCKRKKNVVINVKTTLDGSPKGFSSDLAKYDYPLQACLEISGCLNTRLMESVDEYYWLVVEKVPPYNATVYQFDQEDQKYFMDELTYVLKKTKRAMDENMYPGYSDRADNQYGILKASIPLYYKSL